MIKTNLNLLFRNEALNRLLIACAMAITSLAAEAEPQIEVMHWWNRGGELRAMQVLKDEFETRGGTWFDVGGEDQITVLNKAVSRMAKGYAPTLVQWNSGWEVAQIRRLGLLNSIEPSVIQSLENQFISNVMDMVMVNEELVAIPVNVHSENWFWYKPANYPDNTVTALDSWHTFLERAKAESEHGMVALAVGNEPWQQRLLFNNILLGIAGQALYQRIYNDLDTTALDDDRFLETVETFKKIQPYSHSFGEGRWQQQIAAVAANKALATSMGDWAKGEFRNLGLKLGRDYDCAPSPGTADSIILVMDVFALGKVTNQDEQHGQELFLEVVTDSAVSGAFNYLKGSLSPLRDTDTSMLDKCNRIAYQTLDKKGKAIKPHASIGDRGFLARIDHLISQLWTEQSNTSIWTADFNTLLREEHAKRQVHTSLAENEK